MDNDTMACGARQPSRTSYNLRPNVAPRPTSLLCPIGRYQRDPPRIGL